MKASRTRKVYVVAAGKDSGRGLLVNIGAFRGAERWTSSRDEAMCIAPGQARKVIEVLRRAGIEAVTTR